MNSPDSRSITSTVPGRATPPPVAHGGSIARLWHRAPVAWKLSGLFLVGFLVFFVAPPSIRILGLIPGHLVWPWSWYRLLTYPLLQGSLIYWLSIVPFLLVGGFLFERRIGRRQTWLIALLSAVVSAIVYSLFASPSNPAIGGGFVASGFAGAGVATWLRHRREYSWAGHVAAVLLLLLYGLAPLSPDPVSLAMFSSFLFAGAYAVWVLRSPVSASEVPSVAKA
jgi:membrane associated rhomboid family serine protease